MPGLEAALRGRPFMAWAVMAMMGRRGRPVGLFAFANFFRRLKAVHVRHLHVHQDEMERLLIDGGQSPHDHWPGGRDFAPPHGEQADRQLSGWHEAVLGQQDFSAALRPASAAAGHLRPALPRRPMSSLALMASSKSDSLTGLTRQAGDSQFAAADNVSGAPGRREQKKARSPAVRVIAASLDDVKAVHVGHHNNRSARGERDFRLRTDCSPTAPARPARLRRSRGPHAPVCSAFPRGCVDWCALSSMIKHASGSG